MKGNAILLAAILLVLVVLVGWVWHIHNNSTVQSTYWYDSPSHALTDACSWTHTSFEQAKITAFIETCPPSVRFQMLFSDSNGVVIGKWTSNPDFEFTIKRFDKDTARAPLDVVQDWYAKLTPEQQKVCSIQDADRPIRYLKDGTPIVWEEPHPTEHKTRYKINVRPEVYQAIWDEYEGDPGGSPERDYMCGHEVGNPWGGRSPYFEFDDRSPGNYVQVGAYGEGDEPFIDLNTLQF
jgi:hypothetical protein